MRYIFLTLALALAACSVETSAPTSTQPAVQRTAPVGAVTPAVFNQVVTRMEPVAEAECRARTRGTNCDFLIQIDRNRNQPPNAFQTLNDNGRPVIIFNVPLLEDLENADQLAFVFGHEAAHHIQGHLGRLNENAQAGAVLGGVLASVLGGSGAAIDAAQQAGANVGARSYSQSFELEADQLGTIIAARAGFDPVRGSQYFLRLRDPGNTFLGTHPPNAQRMEVVRQTAARL
ncbi:MAG: M48 family metalloprotease [Pseudomonadota bacterium]